MTTPRRKPRQSPQKPARAPRLSVTLPAPTRAVLDRLSALNGVPAARIVAECMTESVPVLVRIADAIERVHQVNAEKAHLIRASLSEARAEAEKTAATALALLDRIARPEDMAEGAGVASGTEGVPAPKPRRRQPPPSC